MNEFVLINGQVVTQESVFAASVFVKNGKIAEIKRGSAEPKKGKKIDIGGHFVLPGLIDTHVHFRTPGMTQKEDWKSGSMAALAGGVTTVLDMPNTDPPTIGAAALAKKRAMVKGKALVNYGFYAGATEQNVNEVIKLKNIAGVKIYMGSSTGSLLVSDRMALEKFFAKSKKILAIHAESEACIQEGMKKFGKRKGAGVHSLVRGPECAYEATKEVLHLAKKYGTRVHICHVTTDKEVNALRKFKGANVSAEATPHHLFLTEKDYAEYGNLIKVNPPIRGLIDQVSLWEGIKKGWIDMVSTDHAPHLLAEKKRVYANVPSGVPGVQTMLPLLLDAVGEGKLSLPEVVRLTSFNPAKYFKIKGKGVMKAGMDADLTVVNMKLKEKLLKKYIWSKCGWSPFENWSFKAWPVLTFVNGNRMYMWRDKFGKEKGKEVQFGA